MKTASQFAFIASAPSFSEYTTIVGRYHHPGTGVCR